MDSVDLRRVALAALGLALLAWVVTRQPLGSIGHEFARLGPVVAVLPVLGLAWFACNTTALYVLMDGRVPWRALMWNRMVGEGYNALLPGAGFAGEPFKARHLRAWVPVDRAVAALVTDRLVEDAVALVWSAVCILGALAIPLASATRTGFLLWGGGAAIVGVAFALVAMSRLPGRFGNRVARWFGAAVIDPGQPGAAGHVAITPRRLITAAAACGVGRIFGMVEVVVLFALLGIPITVAGVAFTFGALTALGFIGFALPQGIGVTEAGTLFVLGLLGVPAPIALAFALARRGRMLLISLAGVGLRFTAKVEPSTTA